MDNAKLDALKFDALIARADKLLARLEQILPGSISEPDWLAGVAFRYVKRGMHAALKPIAHVGAMRLTDLQDIDVQKQRLVRNTEQFVRGLPANNVLLTGARGTGKSSLVRACLNTYAPLGLRLIEMDKGDLVDLLDVVSLLEGRKERFIIFSDDLSFDEGEAGYKALKSVLDGSLSASLDNVLIYATSNRRHLLPEYMKDNESVTHHARGDISEIHPGEVIEEKISLSERFGLWLSFYPFSQEEYLRIATHWLQHYGQTMTADAKDEALVFALERGSRSGRVAFQFAKDHKGRADTSIVGKAGTSIDGKADSIIEGKHA
jgi:uncharacterized protein